MHTTNIRDLSSTPLPWSRLPASPSLHHHVLANLLSGPSQNLSYGLIEDYLVQSPQTRPRALGKSTTRCSCFRQVGRPLAYQDIAKLPPTIAPATKTDDSEDVIRPIEWLVIGNRDEGSRATIRV